MSEEYNPEAALLERLESLEVEAREVRRRRDEAVEDEPHDVLHRQLREIEEQIEALKRRLKR